VPASAVQDRQLVVMNGNQALGLGVLAAGIEVVSMYPITPATSVSHYLARALPRVGGCVHQAEDEIAAIGFAHRRQLRRQDRLHHHLGAGLALKTEFLGLAVMAEIPLVSRASSAAGRRPGCRPRSSRATCWRCSSASPATRRRW
jgi:2-oxoglutarate/2-oxoacid ferredoxin oxidoreductase subunit alpha